MFRAIRFIRATLSYADNGPFVRRPETRSPGTHCIKWFLSVSSFCQDKGYSEEKASSYMNL